jgi:2-phospho-L-lactate guanylyltransferase
VRVALIAAKQLEFAKTRLAPSMTAADRRALAEAMYRDVLAAALSARKVDHVAVISSDELLLEIGRRAGAILIDEQYPRGLNAAVRLATDVLVAEGAEAVCVVLSDIPLVTGADIDAIFDAVATPRGVALVPSKDLTGTNMIVRRPPSTIPTRFGRMSLMAHLKICEQAGAPCVVVRQTGPALDIDLASDLAEFLRVAGTTHTLSELIRMGMAQY